MSHNIILLPCDLTLVDFGNFSYNE